MTPVLNLRAIIPSQEALSAMGRRRYQKPEVRQSRTKFKNKARWEFRARVDAIGKDGTVRRSERIFPLGECSVIGKREAEKIRDQILAEVINKPAMVLQSQVPYGRVLDEFMEMTRPEVRSHTADSYQSLVDRHLRPAFGTKRLCDLTPQACQKWLQSLAQILSRSTRKNILILFRYIWERATDWNYTRELCPLRRASLGPIESGREKTLPTADQFRRIVQALEEPFRSMLLVATFTGLRISEIRGLRHGDVKDGVLTVRRSRNQSQEVCEVKSAASWRRVPIAHIASAFQVDKPASSDGFLFDVTYLLSVRRLKLAAKAVGIDYAGFGWHTFRRASVTWGKRAGSSQGDSMAQHGHADARTNNLYYVEDDADMKRRAEREAAVFDAVMFGGESGGRG